MTGRLPATGYCCKCSLQIIEGKRGYRERLSVSKPLEELYECTGGGTHGAE